MSAKLTIKYSGPESEVEQLQGYSLKVEVVEAVDMPSKIFVFQRWVPSATDPESNNLGDKFISVADPVDLEEYPEDAPDLENDIPYYRTDSVILHFRSMSELAEVRGLLGDDFAALVKAMQQLEEFPVAEEVVYE